MDSQSVPAPESAPTLDVPPSISSPPVKMAAGPAPWLKNLGLVLLATLFVIGIFFLSKQILSQTQSPVDVPSKSVEQPKGPTVSVVTPTPTPEPATSISSEFQELESIDTTLPTDPSLSDPLVF